MLATVPAADNAKVQKIKYSVFIYSEAETHPMYAIYKQTRKLCVLQYQDMDVTFSFSLHLFAYMLQRVALQLRVIW